MVTPFITRLFYSEVIDGVESALIGAGYDLTEYRLKNNSEQRKVLFDCFLVSQGVDAATHSLLFLSDDEVQRLRQLRQLRQLRKPVGGRRIPSPTFLLSSSTMLPQPSGNRAPD